MQFFQIFKSADFWGDGRELVVPDGADLYQAAVFFRQVFQISRGIGQHDRETEFFPPGRGLRVIHGSLFFYAG